jgi:phytanoyl-CoA hydroxylase
MLLTADNHLADPLWIDQPDALDALDAKMVRGEIGMQEGEVVRHFIDHGYAIIEPPGLDAAIDNLLSSVDLLWRTCPADLLAAGPIREGRPFPMSVVAGELQRGPGVRILDLHSHAAGALALYLDAEIHRICGLLFGEPAVATQSIYFEYGSTQSLHRDPWYVNHTPRTHLLAAWIALEDISADSGPLTYVPGSHRLPFYRFSTDDIVFHDPRVTTAEKWAAVDHMNDQIKDLETRPFTARKGQVFLWHSALVHGGSPVADPGCTRNSLVVHFGTSSSHPRRGGAYNNGETHRVFYTERRYRTPWGAEGFYSPVMGLTTADAIPA